MKVNVLIENTTTKKDFITEHGLSLYIETIHHNILFDTGQSNNFIQNAKALDIDLSTIDIVILSHGHYDHCGGLKALLELNHHCKVYIQESAFNGLYSDKGSKGILPIGIDETLKNHPQVITLIGDYIIDEELSLLNSVKSKYKLPSMNQTLKTKGFIHGHETFINDDFSHEQNLIIKEDQTYTLIAGCAHKGIMNILESYSLKYKHYPNYVISGFHLSSDRSGFIESSKVLKEVSAYLSSLPCQYYTGHCTGLKPYNFFKDNLGQQINGLSTGMRFTCN